MHWDGVSAFLRSEMAEELRISATTGEEKGGPERILTLLDGSGAGNAYLGHHSASVAAALDGQDEIAGLPLSASAGCNL